MKKEELKGIQVSELTPYEKFCRLPKCIWRLQRGCTNKTPFHLTLEYFENNASLDDCTLEYNAYSDFDYEECAKGCHWHGTFEEVTEKAYQHFYITSELLECESKAMEK